MFTFLLKAVQHEYIFTASKQYIYIYEENSCIRFGLCWLLLLHNLTMLTKEKLQIGKKSLFRIQLSKILSNLISLKHRKEIPGFLL